MQPTTKVIRLESPSYRYFPLLKRNDALIVDSWLKNSWRFLLLKDVELKINILFAVSEIGC